MISVGGRLVLAAPLAPKDRLALAVLAALVSPLATLSDCARVVYADSPRGVPRPAPHRRRLGRGRLHRWVPLSVWAGSILTVRRNDPVCFRHDEATHGVRSVGASACLRHLFRYTSPRLPMSSTRISVLPW